MKLFLDEVSFLKEGIENKFKELFENNLDLLDKEKKYNLTIDFFNPDIELEELLITEEDMEVFEIRKEFYIQTRKIRDMIEELGINMNNIHVYGTNQNIHKERINIEIEEDKQKSSSRRIRVIPNKELFLYRGNAIFLEKLMEKEVISFEEYESSISKLRREYGINYIEIVDEELLN